MELKVWVDGIQRVVCGANLSTTCQDVVVALAHAMGRTGRFTLIEKWRDVERPLTPAECPLQALHKWGEYASEVRFYLMQASAEPEKAPSARLQKNYRSGHTAEEERTGISNNLVQLSTNYSDKNNGKNLSLSSSLPLKASIVQQSSNQSQNSHISYTKHPHPGASDSIKRSSTFTGAVNSHYSPLQNASSSISSGPQAKLENLKQQQQQQQRHNYQQYTQPQQHHNFLPKPHHRNKSPAGTQPQASQHYQPSTQQYSSNHFPAPIPEQHYENLPDTQNSKSSLSHYHQNRSNQIQPTSFNSNQYRRSNTNTPVSPVRPYSSNSSPRDNNIDSHMSSTHGKNSLSQSPGRSNDSEIPSGFSSTSQGYDSRYLQPANLSQPSTNYPPSVNFSKASTSRVSNPTANSLQSRQMNVPSPRFQSDSIHQQRNQQQLQLHTNQHQPTSDKPRDKVNRPTPAPRNQNRQSSPSQPYENLPIRPHNKYVEPSSNLAQSEHTISNRRQTPNIPLSPNSQLISNFSNQQNRSSSRSRERSTPMQNPTDFKNTRSYPYQNHENKPNPVSYSQIDKQFPSSPRNNSAHISSSDHPKSVHSPSKSKFNNNYSYNDHNYSSDLSDDCFQDSHQPDIVSNRNDQTEFSKLPSSHHPMTPSSALNSSRPIDIPSQKTKQSTYPIPQTSRSLPNHSSSVAKRTKSLTDSNNPNSIDNSNSLESASVRSKSQTQLHGASTVFPERMRRSNEGNKVNFVASALIRQQRSNAEKPYSGVIDSNNNTEPNSQHVNPIRLKPNNQRPDDRIQNTRPSDSYLNIKTSQPQDQVPNSSLLQSYNDGRVSNYNENNQKSHYFHDRGIGSQDLTDGNTLAFPSVSFASSSSSSTENYLHPAPTLSPHHHSFPNSNSNNQTQNHNQTPLSPRASAFKVVSPRSPRHSNRTTPLPLTATSPSSSSSSSVQQQQHLIDSQPVAYNLDYQNFDLPVNLNSYHQNQHPPVSSSLSFPYKSSAFPEYSSSNNQRTHSRQTSLEVEEYDLDQNFPDVFHQKDTHQNNNLHHQQHQQQHHNFQFPYHHQSSTLPRISGRKSLDNLNTNKQQGHSPRENYVSSERSSKSRSLSTSDAEYKMTLRQVKMQQDQLKAMENELQNIDSEISILENDQSTLDLKLLSVTTDLETLTQKEELNQSELDDLDRVEWDNVIDGETKCEADLRNRMSKLQSEMTETEKKLERLKLEEGNMSKDLVQEKERLTAFEKEEEIRIAKKMSESKAELSALEEMTKIHQEKMEKLEKETKEFEERLQSQEKEAQELENLLKTENLKEFKDHPVPKQTAPKSAVVHRKGTQSVDKVVPSGLTQAQKQKQRLSSEGEAILKILEERKSPRVSPSPFNTDDSAFFDNNQTESQHSGKSTTIVKNPDGVWV